ncbi:MAG TPA: BON domain-containing protein [Gemmatimonadaceae bacterium]|nr:BON domain-containing protein [Gemmatimonadaceae bacterium]
MKNGVVELSGTVADRWAKRRACDDAEDCSGVREVHNRLKVGQSAEWRV